MATFAFELVSPERLLLSGEATEVSIPGTDGYFTVMANHAPFMSTIKPGIISVKQASGEQSFVVLGGFADVTPAGCTILAERAAPKADVSAADIDAEIAKAKDAGANAKSGDDMANAAALADSLMSLKAML
ncbi:MAG: F0F1 ATP synthase subunit epsilon [Rhizobiaceae bacterium]|jgi:F-type H+-transporting ATPase subunit epsilon|nr:F0F1 ATP synthase subunit epsilon [Rhizobiaceae bacterium]